MVSQNPVTKRMVQRTYNVRIGELVGEIPKFFSLYYDADTLLGFTVPICHCLSQRQEPSLDFVRGLRTACR